MNTPQEQIALTKEWLRVQQMCLEAGFDNPFACIKFEEEEWTHGKPTFYGRPNDYEFALAIVEGRPVFKGDMLYVKDSGKKYTGEEISEWNGCTTVNAWNLVSWNPPLKLSAAKYNKDTGVQKFAGQVAIQQRDHLLSKMSELEQQNEQFQSYVSRLWNELDSYRAEAIKIGESPRISTVDALLYTEQTAEAYKRRIQADVVFAVKEELYGYKNHTSDEILIDTVIELIDGIKELKGE